MYGGYVKLPRALLDEPVWRCGSSDQKCLLVALMLLASYAHGEWVCEGEKIQVSPGQIVTSYRRLADMAGMSVKKLRCSLERLEDTYQLIRVDSAQRYTVITLANWDKTQGTASDYGTIKGTNYGTTGALFNKVKNKINLLPAAEVEK